MPLKLVVTGDGSHSIYNSLLDEHYHSIHGSIRESGHVFIDAGLKEVLSRQQTDIHILEIGLGTGLNVLLTYLHIISLPEVQINYTAIEPYPLTNSMIEELNYPELLKANDQKEIFQQIHLSAFNSKIFLKKKFSLLKKKEGIQDVILEEKYTLVYFDAFGPRVQPEMWSKEVFEKLFSLMAQNSILVTYCAKGEVKRTLKQCGFIVETLPGPPGKREMIRARKKT